MLFQSYCFYSVFELLVSYGQCETYLLTRKINFGTDKLKLHAPNNCHNLLLPPNVSSVLKILEKEAKGLLTSPHLLVHYEPSKKLIFLCDASSYRRKFIICADDKPLIYLLNEVNVLHNCVLCVYGCIILCLYVLCIHMCVIIIYILYIYYIYIYI